MEDILKTRWIKCLNRNELIEFLIKENFTSEAQILKCRDIDGERFVNFTELDLIQWKLTAPQKKILLKCRNQLLSDSSDIMSFKPTVTERPNPSIGKMKEKQDIAKNLENVLKRNITDKPKNSHIRPQMPLPRESNLHLDRIRSQMPLPALPRESNSHLDTNHDLPESNSEKNFEGYVDMTMNSKVITDNKPPTLSRSAFNFKPEDHQDSHQGVLPGNPYKHTDPVNSRTKFKSYQGDKINNNNGSLSKTNRKPEMPVRNREIFQTVDHKKNADCSGQKPMIYTILKSESRSLPKDISPQKRDKCPPVPKPPTVPQKNLSEHNSTDEEVDPIYEEEPVIKPKLPSYPTITLGSSKDYNKEKSSTSHSKKGSIQSIPLPDLPNKNVDKFTPAVLPVFRICKAPTEPTTSAILSKPRVLPKPNEKPKTLLKPTIKNKPEGCNETRATSSELVNDLKNIIPPEDFQDSLKTETTTKPKNKELSELPRPPTFKKLFEQEQIRSLHDLIPDDDDDDSSSDGDSFNPNNYAFFRNTDRKGAKQLLKKVENQKNGLFLLRPSTNPSYFLGLTVLHDNQFYNLGVHRDGDGKFFCESVVESETVKFRSLNSFVDFYKDNELTVKNRDGRVAELYLKYSLPKDIF